MFSLERVATSVKLPDSGTLIRLETLYTPSSEESDVEGLCAPASRAAPAARGTPAPAGRRRRPGVAPRPVRQRVCGAGGEDGCPAGGVVHLRAPGGPAPYGELPQQQEQR